MKHAGHLLRVLGIVFGLSAVVGGVIGQGILRGPGVVAQATGSPWLIMGMWLVGGLVALVGAASLAELGAAIPRAGGHYTFVARGFGARTGIVFGVASLAAFIAAQALLVYVTGEFLVRLGIGGETFGPASLGLMTLAGFCALNALGTRVSGASQIVFAAIKGAILIGLVLVLFANPGAAPAATPPPLIRGEWLAFATAMVVVVTTYNGWAEMVFFAEELENPGRTVPRALFGGILLVMALYLAINLALLHILGADRMAGSELPAADAAGLVFGARGDLLLTIFGVISVGALSSLSLMQGARLGFAMTRAGVFPDLFERVNKGGTPVGAMLFVAAITVPFVVSGTYPTLVSMSGVLAQTCLMAVLASVLTLRRLEPDLPRPFRVPFYPWLAILALMLNGVLLVVFVAQDPLYSLAGLASIAVLSALTLALQRGDAGAIMPPLEVE